MSEGLLSVGIDVGTTSTQMILSRLEIENKASGFAVPEMEITGRKILYESPVHFTPLADTHRVDGEALRRLIGEEYRKAGITRQQVDTGAVIVTGETSRKENAAAVLEHLSLLAGDFVVATAGPHLESVLAAKGSGAVAYSRDTGQSVLHMDIGGGTSNLAWIEKGRILKTGCLNVGGRLVKTDDRGRICYISPAIRKLCKLKEGDAGDASALIAVAEMLAQGLEEAAGLRQRTALLEALWTREAGYPQLPPGKAWVISFSGGVADCIEKELPPDSFGDMGPVLGQAIRKSLLCRGQYRLGEQTIRATVIGAGSHSTQLSGSTVYHRNIKLPMKNLPVVCLSSQEQELPAGELSALIRERMSAQDSAAVLALPGWTGAKYSRILRLAEAIDRGIDGALLVAVEQDMAKALGQAMALRSPGKDCLCIDRVRLSEGDYLDIGEPLGPCLPVAVKTLVLGQ